MFGNYDKAYDEALKPYIDNLKAATGVTESRGQRIRGDRFLDSSGGGIKNLSPFFILCDTEYSFQKSVVPG